MDKRYACPTNIEQEDASRIPHQQSVQSVRTKSVLGAVRIKLYHTTGYRTTAYLTIPYHPIPYLERVHEATHRYRQAKRERVLPSLKGKGYYHPTCFRKRLQVIHHPKKQKIHSGKKKKREVLEMKREM